MARLGVTIATLLLPAMAACSNPGGQGGGQAGTGFQAARPPAGMTAAQAGAYCSQLAQTYGEYVGSIGGSLGGSTPGGMPADLDAKVAIANCQDGNYAAGIPVLQQKLRDARVAVPPPPTG